MITLFNLLLIFNVFAGSFVLFISPFEFCLGYIFIISFLIFYLISYRDLSVNRNFLKILAVLTISSGINVYRGNDTFFLIAKQVSGILITGTAYYLLIKVNNYNIEKLFRIYLGMALTAAIIGLIQEYSFLHGFRYGYDYSWMMYKWVYCPGVGKMDGILRINSIFAEPTHFAITMAPAMFVSLAAISRNKFYYFTNKTSILIISSILIMLSYILTFSIIAYLAIIMSIFLIYFSAKKHRKFKNILIITLITAIFSLMSYLFIPDVQFRVNEAVKVINGSKPCTRSHLTIYAYVSNAFVTFKSFMQSPCFGNGLGSHVLAYNAFITSDVTSPFRADNYTGINKADANCLFFRLISETGLFGVLVVFYFIFRFLIKSGENKPLQIINHSIFILFAVQLIRQGHYFYNGLFFFVWLYYFAYKINKELLLKNIT